MDGGGTRRSRAFRPPPAETGPSPYTAAYDSISRWRVAAAGRKARKNGRIRPVSARFSGRIGGQERAIRHRDKWTQTPARPAATGMVASLQVIVFKRFIELHNCGVPRRIGQIAPFGRRFPGPENMRLV